MSEFFHFRDRKSSSRKRLCAECRKVINVGDPYRSCAGNYEGEFWTMDVHADCQIWANAVIYDDGDGRGFLADEDPSDDYEPEELAQRIRANPPPEAVRARLNRSWSAFVEAALTGEV